MFVSMTVILTVLGTSGIVGVEGNPVPVPGDEFQKIMEHISRISVSIGAPQVRN